MKHQLRILCFILLFIFPFLVFAQVPHTLSYQGILTDSTGTPKPDDTYSFTFKLYDNESGSTAIWSESKNLPIKNGLFYTILGDISSLSSVTFDRPYWLGIKVENEEELTPRIQLTSVGYSMRSLHADTADFAMISTIDSTWSKNGNNVYKLNGNVGIGIENPDQELVVYDSGFVAIDLRNGLAQKAKQLRFKVNDLLRWYIEVAGDEQGDNSGSNFGIARLDDNGNAIGFPLYINRSTGYVGIGTIHPTQKVQVDYGAVLIRNPGDGKVLLDLYSERNWQFRQLNSGPHTALELASVGGGGDKHFIINTGGNVGIGTTSPTAKLTVAGRTKTEVLEITGGSDLAEPFEMSESELLPAGSVVVIDDKNSGKLKLSSTPYDSKVAGIISGAGGINPGLTLTQAGMSEGGQNVALTGRVYVLATSNNGPIKPGDLLTTSDIPGHAMKATDIEHRSGTTVGKAMSSLEVGDGLVLVLVSLH